MPLWCYQKGFPQSVKFKASKLPPTWAWKTFDNCRVWLSPDKNDFKGCCVSPSGVLRDCGRYLFPTGIWLRLGLANIEPEASLKKDEADPVMDRTIQRARSRKPRRLTRWRVLEKFSLRLRTNYRRLRPLSFVSSRSKRMTLFAHWRYTSWPTPNSDTRSWWVLLGYTLFHSF